MLNSEELSFLQGMGLLFCPSANNEEKDGMVTIRITDRLRTEIVDTFSSITAKLTILEQESRLDTSE